MGCPAFPELTMAAETSTGKRRKPSLAAFGAKTPRPEQSLSLPAGIHCLAVIIAILYSIPKAFHRFRMADDDHPDHFDGATVGNA
jgi:hypothetical protein